MLCAHMCVYMYIGRYPQDVHAIQYVSIYSFHSTYRYIKHISQYHKAGYVCSGDSRDGGGSQLLDNSMDIDAEDSQPLTAPKAGSKRPSASPEDLKTRKRKGKQAGSLMLVAIPKGKVAQTSAHQPHYTCTKQLDFQLHICLFLIELCSPPSWSGQMVCCAYCCCPIAHLQIDCCYVARWQRFRNGVIQADARPCLQGRQ